MGAFIILFIILFIMSAMTGIPMWIFVVLGIVGIAVYLYVDSNNEKKEKEKAELLLIQKQEPYKEYSNRYDKILKEYKKSDYYYFDGLAHYTIIDNKILKMYKKDSIDFMSIERMKKDIFQDKIDIDEIKYYKLDGEVLEQQHITGGGGGGSSLKGAVVGGLIAGDAGAIIGSRNKINEVSTTYTTKDTRKLEITLKNDTTVDLSYKFYDRLLQYIPEKDYENYITNLKSKGRK